MIFSELIDKMKYEEPIFLSEYRSYDTCKKSAEFAKDVFF